MSRPSHKGVEFKHRAGKPECFTQEAWDEWSTQNCYNKPPREDGFCSDCTPDFQAKHIAQRTCSFPGVKFALDDDGFPHGFRKASTVA